MVIFAKPISGLIRVQNLLKGIRSNNFRKLTVFYKKSDCHSCFLYVFEISKSVAYAISTLMSSVISEIIITRALGTRVIISSYITNKCEVT